MQFFAFELDFYDGYKYSFYRLHLFKFYFNGNDGSL